MPAQRWRYDFILLFPIFLPERSGSGCNHQKRRARTGRDELLLVRDWTELSADRARAAAEQELFPTASRLHQGRDIQLHRGYQPSSEIPRWVKIETSIGRVIPQMDYLSGLVDVADKKSQVTVSFGGIAVGY
jgi:hypothetical protein